jgi:beta-glucanase (GH16 family)
MFGHVDFVVKAAPGAGIVSSAVLQSDCLDEIDWEWLGGDNNQVQSNYFGKGITTTYNRGAYHGAPGNHDGFKTYSIDWTSEQIVWQIDGVTVRAMKQENAAEGQYPQTPMMVKVGAWSGGDSANAPGTIAWSGGPTDYSAGPYTMYLKSIAVTDYSTGTQYTYSGSAGTWQSIQSTGGTVNPKGGSDTPADTANAPAVTAAAEAAPLPFEGTHRDDSSTYVTPSVWPWVGSATATLQTSVSTASVTTYPGLPAGWIVMDDGRVLPPSNAAPMSSSSPSFHTTFVISFAFLWYRSQQY